MSAELLKAAEAIGVSHALGHSIDKDAVTAAFKILKKVVYDRDGEAPMMTVKNLREKDGEFRGAIADARTPQELGQLVDDHQELIAAMKVIKPAWWSGEGVLEGQGTSDVIDNRYLDFEGGNNLNAG